MESAFNVLAGFSLAGLAARVYVHRYPTGVAGMLLVGSTMAFERT
jgi:pimeloyl-ACP methyl ester carboxylesterase